MAQHRRDEVMGGLGEDFLKLDIAQVSDEMLLTAVLSGSTGARSAQSVAQEILVATRGNLDDVTRFPLLKNVQGVGPMAKAKLLAVGELYRRGQYRAHVRSLERPVSSPNSVVEVLRTMATGPEERLVALFLNQRRIVVNASVVTVGTDGFTIVDPKQIFRKAITYNATAVILCHQHPTGDPTPSPQDREVTRKVATTGRILGIQLLDHIVLGSGYRFTSLAEEGELSAWGDSSLSMTGP